jgi:hypothetical protein
MTRTQDKDRLGWRENGVGKRQQTRDKRKETELKPKNKTGAAVGAVQPNAKKKTCLWYFWLATCRVDQPARIKIKINNSDAQNHSGQLAGMYRESTFQNQRASGRRTKTKTKTSERPTV